MSLRPITQYSTDVFHLSERKDNVVSTCMGRNHFELGENTQTLSPKGINNAEDFTSGIQ